MPQIVQVRMFGRYCTIYEGHDTARIVQYLNLVTYWGFTFNVRIRSKQS